MPDSNQLKKLLNLPYHGKNVTLKRANDHNSPAYDSLLFIKNKSNLGLLEKGNCFLCPASLKKEIDLDPEKCFFFSANFTTDFIKALDFLNPHKELIALPAAELTQNSFQENPNLAQDMKFGPFCSLGRECQIGENCHLKGHNHLGHRVKIGNNVTLNAGVVLETGTVIGDNVTIEANTVIGSSGFGYEKTEAGLMKIPQIGNVVIGNNVEIGSNVSIDRATINSTIIGNDVKIDNLVQIAHNVVIGDNAIIVSQAGIAGSSKIGKNVILAGQAGISDHVTIEDQAMIGPQSGVPSGKTIAKKAKVLGSPAMDIMKRLKLDLFLLKLYEKKTRS